jgi:hypothetical protein
VFGVVVGADLALGGAAVDLVLDFAGGAELPVGGVRGRLTGRNPQRRAPAVTSFVGRSVRIPRVIQVRFPDEELAVQGHALPVCAEV